MSSPRGSTSWVLGAVARSGLVLVSSALVGACFNPDPGQDSDTEAASTGAEGDGSETGMGCPDGRVDCGGLCVDLESSAAHCGACGMACGDTQECVAGECVLEPCQIGVRCGEECVDTDVDPLHCGGCGIECDDVEECAQGECVFVGCEFGELCGDTCVDTQTDLQHCGGCDNDCPQGGEGDPVCIAGECGYECPPPLADCDPMVDGCESDLNAPMTCGACDHVCEPMDACASPECVGARQLVANGDFSADMMGWTTENNPLSTDPMVVFFVNPDGQLDNGSSGGPNAKVAFQDFEVPLGMIAAAEFSVCFFQDTGGLDPQNVSVIEADPGDMGGGGPQNAFRIDLIDPAEDVFYAPILLELYAPVDAVGVIDMCEVATFADPALDMLLQAYEGQMLRLRLGQVESTFPWQLEVDDISLAVDIVY